MTKEKSPTTTQDGQSKAKSILTEGYIRKGGSNTAESQVQTRPPAPEPMQSTKPQGAGTAKPAQSGGTKQEE